jgi:NodT family efflux transporter outer membrane factor (OMF) lipoprotein
MRRLARVAAVLPLLAGCMVGPDYRRPEVEVPPAWAPVPPWQPARPDDAAARGPWWAIFGDARLDALEGEALAHSPTLAAAGERLVQARALASAASAALLPQAALDAGGARERTSANRPLASYALPNSSTVQDDFTAGFTVRYEPDLFGGLRRQAQAARAAAEQAQAGVESARLVLAAELAADYFNLRELDRETDIVEQNIVAQRQALDFVRNRRDIGVASGLDLAQAQAQLDATTTQADLLRVQRAQVEHAIATLVARPAPGFAIEPQTRAPAVPPVPVGIPAQVLQRRPDVASAERAMAAANERIGVARSAYFPGITLASGYGVESNHLSDLFRAASNLWSLGVSAAQVLFDGGIIAANVDFAQADYRAAVDAYRQTVLAAMQEVEDGMTGTAYLASAAAKAQAAVKSAQRVAELANDRYAGGLANYLDVITAEQALLANQRQQAQINGQQMVTTVYLVKALGGGWAAPDGPTARN